jgi:hypothetical protein
MLNKLLVPESYAVLRSLATALLNERLIIRDVTGNISPESFKKLASKADLTLTRVLQFWSTEPRIKQFGKIVVEFDHSDPKANYSFFFFRQEKGQKVRVVGVFGGGEDPHHLAHN